MKVKELKLIFILNIVYFIFPKIDLISIPGFPTGIRVQDLIALTLLAIHLRVFANKRINKHLFIFYVVSFFGVLNGFLNGVSLEAFLGFSRFLEYIVIAYSLYKLLLSKLRWNFLFVVVSLNVFIAFLQYNLLFPLYDPGRGGFRISSEFSASFSNSAEFSYFLIAIILVSISLNRKYFSLSNIYGLRNILLSSFIFLNGVRASFLPWLGMIIFNFKRRLSYFFMLVIFLFFLVIFYDYLLEQVMFIWLFVSIIFENILVGGYVRGDLTENFFTFSDDLSLFHRISKWIVAISITLNNWNVLLFGYGAYSAYGAMDGGLVRFFFEFGLIGIIYILYYLRKIPLVGIVAVLASNLFYDGYLSSSVMPLYICSVFLFLNKEKISVE